MMGLGRKYGEQRSSGDGDVPIPAGEELWAVQDTPTSQEASVGGGTEETFRAGNLHRLSVAGPWGRSHGK